jgi:thioester reductase-like protein
MCFDLSIVQIFSALTSGATVCIASTPVRKDPARLAKFIQEAGVTVTYFTPTHFALLMESSAQIFRLCANYRIAFFAGERLSARVVDNFRALKTPATILNTWSPSELVVQTTIHRVTESETGDVNIPIGFPMANCRHYILDTQMNPLPAGLIGEICVGGSQVGAGYLNRPEANAASFVTDPFCSADDTSRGWTRLFRTGDKGRFLPDGKLEFHGRIAGDKQIKLRGFRIDLGEVEHRIHLEASKLTGPKLVDISMVARTIDGKESYTDERQLIAYIVLNQQISLKEQVKYVSTVHKAIAKDLNPYMLPNGYQFLSELPMTIGRKVDRQSLLTRELTLIYPSSKTDETVAETNMGDDQQKVLVTIFQLYREVLKLPKDREISASDNFFELGGQSILLLRLQAKLKRNYKKATPSLPELFKAPFPLAISQKICGLPTTPATSASTNAATKQIINWTAEATLPSDKKYLVRYGASTLSSSDITAVLVTGVESFIGLHVFANMISLEPTKQFHLLGSEKPIEVNDVIADLKQYKLLSHVVTEELVRSQTTLVPGSLMQPGFGLDKTTFNLLGRSVQAIYHLGGRMSLLKNYETLRRANAGATMDLIELAACGLHRTELHYLSTWSVPHLQSHAAAKRQRTHIEINETTPDHFLPSEDAELFYFKARWVSEMLLTRAAERGFNVSITRASAVSGSTATNVPAPDDDFVRRMIVDMVALGSVPDLHGPSGNPAYAIDFIPVNYLSSAIQSLTTSDALRDEKSFTKKNLSIYHIGNPSPLNLHSLPKLMTQLRVDGKEGKLVSLQDWLAEMKAKAKTEGDVLRWEAVKNVCETGHVMFALDHTGTQKALEEVDSELTCPPMDTAFLKMLGA